MRVMSRTRPCHGLLYLTLLLWTRRAHGLADFSNFLSRIVTSHSAHACDGQPLRLHCPRHSTISVQSAFYGSGSGEPCGSSDPRPPAAAPAAAAATNHSCSAFTALQKLLSECQSRRDCQLPVHHLLFGKDPCPGTAKYLHVNYKCKPTEHKRHVSCEGETAVLRCKPPRVLNIYAAVYGRSLGESDTCPSHLRRPPPFECLSHEAVHPVSSSCYGKQRCAVAVGNQTFRDPCFPGTRKYLSVLYSCVPAALLKEADPRLFSSTSSPAAETQKAPPADVVERGPPRGSRRPESSGAVMSDSLLTYAFIRERPEMAALLFTSSVCVGLLVTLLAVSVRVSCRWRRRRRRRVKERRPAPEARGRTTNRGEQREDEEEDDDDDDEDDVEGTESSLISTTDRKAICDWEEVTYVSEAAERAERIERRDMIMQEIWMNAYLNGSTG